MTILIISAIRRTALGIAAVLAAGCGGGTDTANDDAASTETVEFDKSQTRPCLPRRTCTYSIGGSVSGWNGSGPFSLTNNGGDLLQIEANGSFSFTARQRYGTAYAVSVAAQPPGQSCVVTNSSGTVKTTNITSVSVACTGLGQLAHVIHPWSNQVQVFSIKGASQPIVEIAGSPFTLRTGTNDFVISPDGSHAYASVSGLSKQFSSYSLAAATRWREVSGSPIGIPKAITNFSMHASGRFMLAYGGERMNIDPATGLASSAPGIGDNDGVFAASTSWDGRFAYAGIGSAYTIAHYAVDPSYALISTGGTQANLSPDYMVPDPSGRWLLVTATGWRAYAVYAIDPATGALTRSTATPELPVLLTLGDGPGKPVFTPSGSHVLVPNLHDQTVSVFAFDPIQGDLIPVAGSPFPAGGSANWLAVDKTGTVVMVTNRFEDRTMPFVMNASTGALSPHPTGALPFASTHGPNVYQVEFAP